MQTTYICKKYETVTEKKRKFPPDDPLEVIEQIRGKLISTLRKSFQIL